MSALIDQNPAAIELRIIKGDSFERILRFKSKSAAGVRSDLDVSDYEWAGGIDGQDFDVTPRVATNEVTLRLTNAQTALLTAGDVAGLLSWTRPGATEDEIRTILEITATVREL